MDKAQIKIFNILNFIFSTVLFLAIAGFILFIFNQFYLGIIFIAPMVCLLVFFLVVACVQLVHELSARVN